MNKDCLLENAAARELYKSVSALPIIDYHCHLSPREIFENKPFTDIGELWLSADHYKWRLMRSCGISEEYITGGAPMREKFRAYAGALEFAAGNPLYLWSHMELSRYFGIDTPLSRKNADMIWEKANDHIRRTGLSPRKLICDSGVELICTTDDIADSLEWHARLAAHGGQGFTVLPSFRTDNVFLMKSPGYTAYLARLSGSAGVEVNSLKSLKEACIRRLDHFTAHGCVFTDVGIPFFPDTAAPEREAERIFARVLAGEDISEREYKALVGNLYLFFACEYKRRGLVMQLHLAVYRNANSALFRALGADCGGDTVGNAIDGTALIRMLDAMNGAGALPQTVLYTLNPANAAQIASVAGAFPGVRLGAAWWFCDHKRGIIEQLETIAENGSVGEFLGMLTDSRSFLSYARHDYFRRILCTLIGDWVEKGEYNADSAVKLAERICCGNIRALIASARK